MIYLRSPVELHDLEIFLAVAREKSFSRAAKAVLRTQPAISLAVRRLENELEHLLFDRTSKEPVLTEEGKLVHEYAQKLLALRNDIRPALREIHQLQKGRVRIGANETGALFLLPHIRDYRNQFPDVKIEIVRTFGRDIPRDLLSHAI